MPDYAIGSKKWNGLSKVMEESAEVIQVGAKIIGNVGETIYWEDVNLVHKLEEELGDLLATIVFLVEKNPLLNPEVIKLRRNMKLARFRRWNDFGNDKKEKSNV